MNIIIYLFLEERDIRLSNVVYSPQLPSVDIECHAPRLHGPNVDLPDIEVSEFKQSLNSTENFQKELKERLDFLSAKAEKLFLDNEKNFTQGFYQGFILFAFAFLAAQ